MRISDWSSDVCSSDLLSYDRGAMYFAMLNGEIVHQSGGTRSIDDLVRAMVAIQRDEGKEPTEQDWIALLRHDLGDKGARIHEGMMSGALRMVPRADAFGRSGENTYDLQSPKRIT